MRRAANQDRVQGDVVRWLRGLGWWVTDTSKVGDGFPDLLMGRNGELYQVEVKSAGLPPSKMRLSRRQIAHAKAARSAGCSVLVITSVADCLVFDRMFGGGQDGEKTGAKR